MPRQVGPRLFLTQSPLLGQKFLNFVLCTRRKFALASICGAVLFGVFFSGCCSSPPPPPPPPVDCEQACTNVMACKGKHIDKALAVMTRASCLNACRENRVFSKLLLDIDDRTEINKSAWRCAALNTSCEALDGTCDVF
jgi:hypothetical protein